MDELALRHTEEAKAETHTADRDDIRDERAE
jgi:hypothetical protein